MAESDSVTREDAVKKLNTEIIAGNGPDLIVMDGLPFMPMDPFPAYQIKDRIIFWQYIHGTSIITIIVTAVIVFSDKRCQNLVFYKHFRTGA